MTCPTYEMTLLHKRTHCPSTSLNLMHTAPMSNKRYGEHTEDSSSLSLCVCPHSITKRKLPGCSRDAYSCASACAYKGYVALSACSAHCHNILQRQRGSEREMHLKWSKTQLMPSICSSTHRAQVQAEQRTLRVSVASLNSVTLYRMKSHSEQSYHHHTSVKMEKHSQPLSLLRSRLFQNNCYPPTDSVLQMKEKSSFSFPKGVPSLLQLGLSHSLKTMGGVTTKEEHQGDHIIAIWVYRNYPNFTWAPHPESLALSFNKVLAELQLQWASKQGCWNAWSVDKGCLIHSLI